MKQYLKSEKNKAIFISVILFALVVVVMAWQSDDAYHAYIMAKNLVLGNGFVYNVGERATASSCPLFTLIVAFAYFFIRKMFIASLLVCVIFSVIAAFRAFTDFCDSKIQVYAMLAIFLICTSFMSFTTAGLENCQLFFFAALFMKEYYSNETFTAKKLVYMAFLISFIAMTRMDAVLMFVPMVVYIYLCKRENVSFAKCVGLGIAGLSPFILWEIFATFYFGFPVPNTAYVKLGTNISKIEYIKRGIQYSINSLLCDPLVLIMPLIFVVFALTIKKWKYLHTAFGVLLYGIYVIYIGGDFMMGRHFTVMFFLSTVTIFKLINAEKIDKMKFFKVGLSLVVVSVLVTVTGKDIHKQFTFGNTFNSPIADERAGYFHFTSLFNNAVSYIKTGELCIEDAWNDEAVDVLREADVQGGIFKMVPGITKYYDDDLYLNDTYALGDPFLSHLPAVLEDDWRIGHMWRESPVGYNETVMFGDNQIQDESLHEYYEIIKLITRGKLFDSKRIKAVIDMNLGKYDYLIENYKNTLDETNRQK